MVIPMKQFHCCITLEGALKEWKYLTIDDRPATLKEIKAAIEDARGKGYSVLPPCDNVGETGHCIGHEL